MIQRLHKHFSGHSSPRRPCTALLLGLLLPWLCAASQAARNETAHPASLSFAALGAGPMEMQGLRTSGEAGFGVRGDQVIVAAKLFLRMTYSPAMLPELSHLRVSLNRQVVAALPLPREQAGRVIERELELDPRYFTDYNQLRFELIGHYTLQCENPQHSSLWLTISPESRLELSVRSLELRNDLALLPAPFFDRRDSQRLELPMVLPAQPDLAVARAAGIAASWFGMLADYRGARFPVASDVLPQRHALVFATNTARPATLQLPDVQEPTISFLDNPANPSVKLLVFQGSDATQLEQAVTALTLGNPAFSGERVTVKGVKMPPRAAYDVPRWLRSDRAVKLGELVDQPLQLQAEGIAPAPIGIELRMPPDLFTWNRDGVPLELRYRYTAPANADNSLLTVSVNNQLLRSYRLRPDDESGAGALRVPLLNDADVQQQDDLVIPAFKLASSNQMRFQFTMQYHHDGLCRESFVNPAREAIDPDSTIDISGFAHYAAMPNLALFANAGYPFTRYADLSQTGVVLPDLQPATLEQLFFVLGRMGRHTGAAATHYQLLDTQQAARAGELDLILLPGESTNQLLTQWRQDLSLRLNGSERVFRDETAAPAFLSDPLRRAREARADREVTINANGSLAALLSFESPLSAQRTVVAFSATDATAREALLDALEDGGKVALMRGDLAIVRNADVQSFQGDEVYYVGSLSWWLWLWFHISQHPVLLTLLAIAMAVGVALLIHGWLQQRLRRRMAGDAAATPDRH